LGERNEISRGASVVNSHQKLDARIQELEKNEPKRQDSGNKKIWSKPKFKKR
jgi:hypothetical protein